MPHAWTITETAFSAATGKAYEGLFTLGSGYLHVRGSLEEHLAEAPQDVEYVRRPTNTTAEKFPTVKAKWGTFVPGIYDEHPTMRQELVNLPWFLGLAPVVDGERLDIEQCTIGDYARTLDMRSATLSRSLTWVTRSGAAVRVVFERFVSAARPHLCVQRMSVSVDRPVTLTVRGGIDAGVRTNGYDHLATVAFERPAEDEVACICTTKSDDTVTMRAHLVAPGAQWRMETADRAADLVADLTIPAQGTVTIEKRTAVTTSRDLGGADAATILHDAAGLPYEMLHAEHAAVWHERWWQSDVVIDGDAESQTAMRASIFHLLRCLAADDPRVAIDAKGYAGEAYRGHFFWDTEMYLLPFFLYTQPERARVLADFRLTTLDGAREMARQYGYPGARYPWQTDTSGLNRGAIWQYGDHEVHVTADVVYGLLHYAKAADPAYLERAAEAIVETARYWTARIDWRLGEDGPSLLGVMGPDEYTPISNNNAYTNRLVSLNLLTAADLRDGDEAAAFRRAAALPIPRRADGLVLQCEEFEGYAEPRFDERWPDRGRVFAAQVPQELLYRTKCLKQADVLMLMYLFPDEFSDAEVRQAWEYYLPYTTHDSSLSAGVHAVLALRLGLREEAWDYWTRTSGFDLDIAHGGAAEGIHIANCGASWQVAVLGFAGLRTAMQAETLTLDPKLPTQWQRLAFPVVWQGCPVSVEITHGGCSVTNRGETALPVVVSGEARVVGAGETGVFGSAVAAR